MPSKTIILRMDNSSVYVNGVVALSYADTNLPKQHFQFRNNELIILEVEQIKYDEVTNTLTVKVVNYFPKRFNEGYEQQPKVAIRRLEFEKLEWSKFSLLLSSYSPNKIGHIFSDPIIDIVTETEKSPNLFFQERAQREPVVEILTQEAKVKFDDAKFLDNCISFTARLKDFKMKQEFFIENLHLRKEYENIKPWFIKKLGRTFKVSFQIRLVDKKVENVIVTSTDIAMINEGIIESIRANQVSMLPRITGKQQKALYDNNEVLALLEDSAENINSLNSSADKIIEILIENGYAKNIKQLQYLSSDKQSLNETVRFTLRPNFGFVFRIDNGNKQFYVWELLNTHATYIWESTSPPEEDFYAAIEDAIAFIRTHGREEFKKQYKITGSNKYIFHFIEHQTSDLTDDERFQSWQEVLEAILSNDLPTSAVHTCESVAS